MNDTLKSQLSALITALANPEHKVGRTLAVDALEHLDDLEHAPGCDVSAELKRASIRARVLLMVYGGCTHDNVSRY